jgi:hypothetical protein
MKRFLFILFSFIAISSYAQNWESCKEGIQSSVYMCDDARVFDYVNWKPEEIDISKIAVKFIVTKDNIQLVTYGMPKNTIWCFAHTEYGVFKFIKQEDNACYYEFEPIEECYDEYYHDVNEVLEIFKTEDTFKIYITTAAYGEVDDYIFNYVSSKNNFNELYNSIIKN